MENLKSKGKMSTNERRMLVSRGEGMGRSTRDSQFIGNVPVLVSFHSVINK
jgi:hypothetical protein